MQIKRGESQDLNSETDLRRRKKTPAAEEGPQRYVPAFAFGKITKLLLKTAGASSLFATHGC